MVGGGAYGFGGDSGLDDEWSGLLVSGEEAEVDWVLLAVGSV